MKKTILFLSTILGFSAVILMPCYAQPYGSGYYGDDIPYGDETSLSISTDGDILIPITPTTDGVLATGNSEITVTSTDVEGYKLYIRALTSTDMDNLGTALPASSNTEPAELAINTWGYNLDASNNFVGITLSDVLIRSTTTPVSSGEITTVTYGMKLDLAKPAGNYVANVIYTAVPQTD